MKEDYDKIAFKKLQIAVEDLLDIDRLIMKGRVFYAKISFI